MNHVTRGLQEDVERRVPQMPILDRHSLEALEAIFPPRCKSPYEDLEAHMLYAGKVELVQALRAAFDSKRGEDPEDEELLVNPEEGEPASLQQK